MHESELSQGNRNHTSSFSRDSLIKKMVMLVLKHLMNKEEKQSFQDNFRKQVAPPQGESREEEVEVTHIYNFKEKLLKSEA